MTDPNTVTSPDRVCSGRELFPNDGLGDAHVYYRGCRLVAADDPLTRRGLWWGMRLDNNFGRTPQSDDFDERDY